MSEGNNSYKYNFFKQFFKKLYNSLRSLLEQQSVRLQKKKKGFF